MVRRYVLFRLVSIVSNAGQCYCGNSLSEGSKKVPEIGCSFSCPGDATQSCGAGNHLTTYAVTGTTTPHTDTPATYKSIGCYTEATTGRALAGGLLADDSMTIAKCSAKCTGFAMFGLEYSRECFCGDELATGSVKAPETDCSYTCSGNSAEICGGSSRLNVYTTGEGEAPTEPEATYARQACYTDSVVSRALTGKQLFTDDMTIEKCSATCKGFTFFGLEYGRECYCGNIINASGEETEDSECTFPCSGDDSQTCGANDLLDVYKFGAVSQPTTTSSTPVPTTTSSTVRTQLDVNYLYNEADILFTDHD